MYICSAIVHLFSPVSASPRPPQSTPPSTVRPGGGAPNGRAWPPCFHSTDTVKPPTYAPMETMIVPGLAFTTTVSTSVGEGSSAYAWATAASGQPAGLAVAWGGVGSGKVGGGLWGKTPTKVELLAGV